MATASDTPSATAATSLPGDDATAACAACGAGSGTIATVPGSGAPATSQSIHASPDTSRSAGQSVPLSTSAWVGTAGLASLLTAPASSLPLATTVFGGGSTGAGARRSEEHTSELQSLMRISYAVFCLKKKKTT